MERRWEQTVEGKVTGARRALYAGAWLLLALLLLGMLVASAGILGETEAGNLRVNWLSLILFAILGALAVAVWFNKDRLRVEYDYVLQDGVLEVFAILNARRRRRSLRVELASVQSCGPASGAAYARAAGGPDVRRHKLYIDEAAPRYFFCYGKGGARHLALLELSDELAAAVRASRYLPVGAWHDLEGKA